MEDKTHYRKAFKSPYLSSADITQPTVLTITHVRLEKDQTNKTKDLFNTAYFKEKEIRPGETLKPMILNATNSRTMKKLNGSAFIEDWVDMPVTVYVQEGIRFGRETVDGLRISTEKARIDKPELKQNTPEWTRAVAAYKKAGKFDSIEKHMTISTDLKTLIMDEANAMD